MAACPLTPPCLASPCSRAVLATMCVACSRLWLGGERWHWSVGGFSLCLVGRAVNANWMEKAKHTREHDKQGSGAWEKTTDWTAPLKQQSLVRQPHTQPDHETARCVTTAPPHPCSSPCPHQVAPARPTSKSLPPWEHTKGWQARRQTPKERTKGRTKGREVARQPACRFSARLVFNVL